MLFSLFESDARWRLMLFFRTPLKRDLDGPVAAAERDSQHTRFGRLVWKSRVTASAMNYDRDKVDEMVLALL